MLILPAPPPPLVTAGGWTPQELFIDGALGAWYDVNDLSTLYQERLGGTTPAVVGGVVGTVRDKSGNGHHMSAIGSDAARGILRLDGTTGKYYIELDGVDDAYAGPVITGGRPTFPAFVAGTIYKLTSGTSVWAHTLLTNTNNTIGFGDNVNRLICGDRLNSVQRSVTTATGGFLNNAYAVGMVYSQDTRTEAYFNADAPVSNETDIDHTVAVTGNYNAQVNRTSFYTIRRWAAGIFMHNKTMTTDEINAARTWLGEQVGLTL